MRPCLAERLWQYAPMSQVSFSESLPITHRHAGVFGSEAPFAPRPGGTAEDDGWVLTFVTDTSTWRSECWVFEAPRIAAGPVARVELPARVPAGFHAAWVPGEQWPN